MIYLTVKLGDHVLDSFYFDDDKKVISIGRNSGNDICIKDNAISRNHAKIEARDNGYLLSDLHSQNGIFVNNEFVTSHWLKSGDTITIGRHTINYVFENEEVVRSMGQTMVLDVTTYKNMRADSFLNVALGEKEREVKGEIFFMDQNRGNLELTSKTIRIGSAPDNDIVAKGLFIGKTSATITKRAGGHYLEYVGGLSKPKVNGKAIGDSILLKHSSVIQIGKLMIKYVVRK